MKLHSIKGIPLSYIQSILKIDITSPSGLTWLPKEGISRSIKSWNAKHANKKAGSKHISIQKCLSWNIGFRYLGKYVSFKCSNIIFLLHNGYLTKNIFIQHIDHNPFNNNSDNLRECTRSQNSQYSKLRKNNTSGHKGVFLTRDKLKWYVVIKLNGKSYYFGTYINKEDAIKASIVARKKLHGEFGRDK
ncbi:MAG: HNH endonuclease [Chryseobacterium sp.]